jgi:hypothetical protein
MKATKKMPKTSRIASRNISACRLNAGSSRVEPVPPYTIELQEVMGIFESKRDRSIHSCTVHRTRLHLSEGNAISRHLSRRSLSAVAVVAVQRESLKPDMWVHEAAETFETWFKAFRGRMQHRLDIAYDVPVRDELVAQSLTTGTVACCHVRL